MQVERENDEETQAIIEAGAAEISTDLFGQGEDGDKSGEPGSESSGAETAETPPAQTTEEKPTEGATAEAPKPEEENSQSVQETGAPKTWTKEALETWATIPDRAKQEILKREEDFMRGIGQYKQAADLGVRYDQVVEPYRAALAAENIDPVGLFQSFAANHYLLSRGTPEQKIDLAAALLTGYNIDLVALANKLNNVEPENPEIASLRREIAELKGGFSQAQTAQAEGYRAQLSEEVNKFADDGQHPYFDEVAEDMARLIQSGLAGTLQDAYDKAVFANPSTRQKEIDRMKVDARTEFEKEEQSRKEKRQKSMGDHVKTMPNSKDGTVPRGSMDDTLNETLAAIESRA